MKIIKRNKTLYTITMTVVMTNMNNIRKQPKTICTIKYNLQVSIHIQELSLADWHFKTLVEKDSLILSFRKEGWGRISLCREGQLGISYKDQAELKLMLSCFSLQCTKIKRHELLYLAHQLLISKGIIIAFNLSHLYLICKTNSNKTGVLSLPPCTGITGSHHLHIELALFKAALNSRDLSTSAS